jgi:hypothetical protein
MPTSSTKFAMNLPEGMVARLAATDWGRRIFDYRRGKDHLFIAVRDRYLSVYVNGRAVFKKVKEENGKLVALFDQRYLLGKDHPSGDLCFNGERVFRRRDEKSRIDGGEALLDFSSWVDRVRTYELAKNSPDDGEDTSEKGALAVHAQHPSVINLEMALPGLTGISKKTGKEIRIAPRIDMIHLAKTEEGAELLFTEAKRFFNGALRSKSENPTVTQILTYRDYLETHRIPICDAYRQACKHLVEIRRHQGITLHPLLSGVADGTLALSLRAMPYLLIFRPRGIPAVSEKAWERHAESFATQGIEIVDESDWPVGA